MNKTSFSKSSRTNAIYQEHSENSLQFSLARVFNGASCPRVSSLLNTNILLVDQSCASLKLFNFFDNQFEELTFKTRKEINRNNIMNHDHHAHHETESQAATGVSSEETHFQEAHSTSGHVCFN